MSAANILLGKRLGFLDFQLPRAISRMLPGGRRVVDLMPALAGMVLAGLAAWGGGAVWDHYVPDKLLALWRQESPQSVTVCTECPELLRIPGGEFWMGSAKDDNEAYSDEKPRHQVTVKPFSLGKYEVTKAQFAAFVKDSGYQARGCRTWNAAKSAGEDQPGKDWLDPGFP